MPIKIGNKTVEEVRAITNGSVPYSVIIEKVEKEIEKIGFVVSEATYKTTVNGDAVIAVLKISNKENSEDSQIFYWNHGHTNLAKFDCAFGLDLGESVVHVVNKQLINPKRRSSNATKYANEIFLQIEQCFSKREDSLLRILDIIELMQDHKISTNRIYEIVGELFLGKNMLTVSQVSNLKPGIVALKTDPFLTDVYYTLSASMDATHPREWLEIQQDLFDYFKNKLSLIAGEKEHFVPLADVKKIVPYEQVGSTIPSVVFL